jgi:hypothetical protein
MRRSSLFAAAVLAAPLLPLVCWPWDASAVAEECKDCLTAPNATCTGFPSVTCLASGCDYCSSGCATIPNLAAVQCAEVEAGGWHYCYPVYTSCATFSFEVIHPCKFPCFCDESVTYYAGCPGAFQTDCNLNDPCAQLPPDPK